MSLGGGGSNKEAERARQEEEARQGRIRQGTQSINSIFDGGIFGSGKATVFDPSATYYNADGTQWSPVSGPSAPAAAPAATPGLTGFTSTGRGDRSSGAPQDAAATGGGHSGQVGLGEFLYKAVAGAGAGSPAEQFAQANANGGLFTGTAQRGGFNDDFYRGIRDSFTNYAMPQLNQQRDDAAKELTFALDRTGQLAGSVRGQKTGQLQRLFDTNEQQVRDQALAYENQARTGVENARADLIGMLNATGDNQQAVNSALSRSTILTQPQAYSPLGQLFTDFTAGLGAQAAQERAAAASGGMYKSRYDTGLFGGSGRVVNRT